MQKIIPCPLGGVGGATGESVGGFVAEGRTGAAAGAEVGNEVVGSSTGNEVGAIVVGGGPTGMGDGVGADGVSADVHVAESSLFRMALADVDLEAGVACAAA